jgi:methyl-accepting chemotaxis protein
MDAFLIKTEIGPILSSVDERLIKLDNQLRAQTDRTGMVMIEQANSTMAIVQVLLVTGLVLGGFLAWIITLVIAQPVDSAALAMDDIAQGEGDLTRRLEAHGRDEIARLATGFNQFIEKIQAVIRQVSEAVGQVTNTAGELTVATENANRVTEQQKQETTQIATAVTQMSANAQEVARHAEMAAQAANKVDDETQAGQRIVAEALEGIRSLVDDTQMVADAVGKLGVDIEDIGSVIAMIGGITDQTNLLALNAAIEAARAGEQGRGFAVVADEVRTLAERTKQSTNDIRGRIESLQSHAHDAVNQMNRNREVAEKTSVLAGRAGESLQSITQSVSSINDMTHQIASSAEEQSTVANEVNLNVCNITRLADDAGEATNSVAANCQSLEQLSHTLNGLVGKFKA